MGVKCICRIFPNKGAPKVARCRHRETMASCGVRCCFSKSRTHQLKRLPLVSEETLMGRPLTEIQVDGSMGRPIFKYSHSNVPFTVHCKPRTSTTKNKLFPPVCRYLPCHFRVRATELNCSDGRSQQCTKRVLPCVNLHRKGH